MEDNEITAQQQQTGEFMKGLTIIGLVSTRRYSHRLKSYNLKFFLPFTATAAFFSMQPGVLPEKAYTWWIFITCWLSLTAAIVAIGAFSKWWPFGHSGRRKQAAPTQARFMESHNQRLNVGVVSSSNSRFFRREDENGTTSYTDDIELGSMRSTRDFLG